MNTLVRSLTLFVLGLMAFYPSTALADSVNPSDVELTVYGLLLSKNADCSSAVQVLSNPGATPRNMVTDPTFGSGSVPKGTYPCVILEISNVVNETPATTTTASGACVAGVPLPTQYICRSGNTSTNPLTGATITCTTGVPTTVYAYFSTGGSAANENMSGGTFNPSLPGPLASPLTVTTDHTLTFVADFDGTIQDSGSGSCNTQGPTMLTR